MVDSSIPLRVLVLCDDYWHPAATPRAGLEPLEKEGFQFDWVENASDLRMQSLFEYPVVILTKSNNVSSQDRRPWVTPEVERAFADYVRSGHGLLVIHSGSAEYAELPVLRALLGGVFASHPPQCEVTIRPGGSTPLTNGIEPFTVHDEHYFMSVDDSGATVFMTTTSEYGEQPGGWTRLEGNGRVCLLTPGHNLEVWLHPQYSKLIVGALRWCAQSGTGGR